MTTGSMIFYDSFSREGVNGTVDLDSNTFVVIPLASGYVPNVATHTRVSNLTNEVTTNGGARIVLTAVALTQTGGVGKFDANDVVFTQSGGSPLVMRYWALANNTPSTDATKPLLCYGLFDITAGGTDVTVGVGQSWALVWNVNGIFTITMTDA